MTDTELADRVVALGVAAYDPDYAAEPYYCDFGDTDWQGMAQELVRDWRVAGVCLERMTCMQISELCEKADGLRYHGWLKKPRTIIEAYVDGENDDR